MEKLKKNTRYQLIESKNTLLGFWITIIIVDIAFYIMSGIYGDRISIGLTIGMSGNPDAISVAGINIMAILIAFIAYNFEENYQGFPLAISLSMTRREYFLSFLADNVFLAFVFASIQGVLLKLDPMIIKMIDRSPLYDYAYFNLQTDSIFYIIFILFVLFLAFTSFWNLLASINYKVGYKMWIVIIGANILITSMNFKLGFVEAIFKLVENVFKPRLDFLQILYILLATAVLYGLNYLIIIRTDIKKKLK